MESVFQQALAHHRAGRLEAAEPLYRQAAAWRPEWVLGNLGVLLRTTGRLEGELWVEKVDTLTVEDLPSPDSIGI